jgi:hypothetical protein
MWKLGPAIGAVLVTAAVGLTPASASAATKVYGGTAEFGGRIAMDVKLSKSGVAKKILEIRGVDVPGTCEQSGPGILLNARITPSIKVSEKGKFKFSSTDHYGNHTTVKGKFSGRKDKRVSGELVYANHFPAEGPYPEEDCATDPTGFKAHKGGEDVVLPDARDAGA